MKGKRKKGMKEEKEGGRSPKMLTTFHVEQKTKDQWGQFNLSLATGMET